MRLRGRSEVEKLALKTEDERAVAKENERRGRVKGEDGKVMKEEKRGRLEISEGTEKREGEKERETENE